MTIQPDADWNVAQAGVFPGATDLAVTPSGAIWVIEVRQLQCVAGGFGCGVDESNLVRLSASGAVQVKVPLDGYQPSTVVASGEGVIVERLGSVYGLAAGSLAELRRYHADGTPDVSFGSGGVLTRAALNAELPEPDLSTPDGVAGLPGFHWWGYTNELIPPIASGIPDGAGGVLFSTVAFAVTGEWQLTPEWIAASAACDPSGPSFDPTAVCPPAVQKWAIPQVGTGPAVFRIGPDGHVDTSFGASGLATAPKESFQSMFSGMGSIPRLARDGFGRIWWAGTGGVGRFLASGQPDPSFHGTGYFPATFLLCSALDYREAGCPLAVGPDGAYVNGEESIGGSSSGNGIFFFGNDGASATFRLLPGGPGIRKLFVTSDETGQPMLTTLRNLTNGQMERLTLPLTSASTPGEPLVPEVSSLPGFTANPQQIAGAWAVGATPASVVVAGQLQGTGSLVPGVTVARVVVGVDAAPGPVAPGAPELTGVVPGPGSLRVSWTPPASDGGSNLTSYRVTATPVAGGPPVVVSASALAWTTTISGLAPGATYTVSLAAENAAGWGEDSAPSAPVATLEATHPGVPAVTGWDPSFRWAIVDWARPTDNGGAAIEEYRVTVSPVSGDVPVVASVLRGGPGFDLAMAPVHGLQAGQSYVVTVAARNSVGWGPESAPFGPVSTMAPTVPGATYGVAVTPGVRALAVSWAPPSSIGDGGLPLTSYRVTATPAAGGTPRVVTVPGTSTSANLTGLANGRSYRVTVEAQNQLGTGPPSDPETVSTPALASAPAVTSVSAGPKLVSVAWSPPASDGGSPVTGYKVVATPVAGGTGKSVTAAATASSVNVTGLSNGTSYTVTVAAVSAVGTGPASAASAVVSTPALASAPAVTSVSAGPKLVSVAWSPPASDGGSPVTGYKVVATPVAGGTGKSVTAAATASSVNVTGLSNGTSYTVTVAAVSAVGTGPASAVSAVVSTPALPSAPPAASVSVAARSLAVTWSPPASDGGSPIRSYTVRARATRPDGTVYTITKSGVVGTSTAVTGLELGREYSVTVAAVNAVGSGSESPAVGPFRGVVGVSVADVSVLEGNTGTVNASFTVRLSGASNVPVSVAVATANGTAAGGSDYVPIAPMVVTFDPGQTAKLVSVPVLGDTVVESDETFFLDLSSPDSAVISRARATGTIRNND